MANSSWCTIFPKAIVHHLAAIGSDHYLILLDLLSAISNNAKPFKFEAMWLQDDSCFDVVDHAWDIFVKGSLLFQISSRTKNVKKALKDWNLNHFGNIHNSIKLISDEIYSLQKQDKTSSTPDLEKNLQFQLDSWLKKSETFWRKKSRDK